MATDYYRCVIVGNGYFYIPLPKESNPKDKNQIVGLVLMLLKI